MRWLIVGPYPPSIDPGATATLAAVRAHLAAGDDVTVVSPDPSAADRAMHVAGATGVARLRRLARGVHGLHLRLGDGVGPDPTSDRASAAAERAALRLLVSAFDEVVIDVGDDDLHRMPGGRVGALVLTSGARFLVDGDEAAAVLIGRGAPAESVAIRRATEPTAFTTELLCWRAGAAVPAPMPTEGFPSAERAAIEQWVRDRGRPATASDRSHTVQPADVLRSVPPLALPAPPAGGLKRVVALVAWRATRWMLDPLVAHVNRLHAAAIEAAEQPPDDPPGR